MTKEQQDLAWKCLPKEIKDFIKNDTATAWQLAYARIFSYHNLTSDTEPEEMLMVERKYIQEMYADGVGTHYLLNLFGDKCLSDKEESTDEVLNALEHYRNTATPDQKANDLRRLESECLSGKEGVDLNKLDKMLDEALEKETPESMKEWLDSQEEQPKQEFKVGDKVVIIQGKYKGVKGIIKIYSEDDNTWCRNNKTCIIIICVHLHTKNLNYK